MSRDRNQCSPQPLYILAHNTFSHTVVLVPAKHKRRSSRQLALNKHPHPMWPFSGSGSSSTDDKIENPAPTRQQRQECWNSRDLYFDCLTNGGIAKAGSETGSVCAMERKAYEGKCGKTWVSCFLLCRRSYLNANKPD
jgi:hypothetical protein